MPENLNDYLIQDKNGGNHREGPTAIIGERINPTGRKMVQVAYRKGISKSYARMP